MAYVLRLEGIPEARLPAWAQGPAGRRWSTADMRAAGRQGAERFSETRFKDSFKALVGPIVD